MSEGDEQTTDDAEAAETDPDTSGRSRSIDAAPARRPSSMRSKSLSTMPKAEGETHQLYLEIASLQMAKARQERIRDSLQQQVGEARRQIAEARERTDQLLEQAGQREGGSGSGAGSASDTDGDADTGADDPETFEY